MTKRVFYTDRSRIDLTHRCPRARYYAYHWGDTGIRKDTVNWDITLGVCVHEGLSVLLGRYLGGISYSQIAASDLASTTDLAVAAAHARLDSELSSTPFDLSEFTTESLEPAPSNLYLPAPGKDTVDSYITYLIDETKGLIELLIRSYAYAPAGLRWLLDTYEVLEVEQEDSFTLVDSEDYEVRFQARADGLLRRRIDGALVVLSFKTTKVYESYKEGAAASDMQGMSEVVAIEERLQEQIKAIENYYKVTNDHAIGNKDRLSALTGIPMWQIMQGHHNIEGVQMIYLLTSETRKDSDGFKRRASGLLRPWIKRGGGMLGDEYAFTASWIDGEGKNRRLGKDWARVNAWELDGGISGYVEMVKDQFDDALGGYPLDTVIVNSQLHRREKDKLERWRRETTFQEDNIAQNLIKLDKFNNSGNKVREANMYSAIEDAITTRTFPHHNNACYDFKKPCQFWELCWGNRHYADDPLASGFKRREPHHSPEKEMFVQIERTKSNG